MSSPSSACGYWKISNPLVTPSVSAIGRVSSGSAWATISRNGSSWEYASSSVTRVRFTRSRKVTQSDRSVRIGRRLKNGPTVCWNSGFARPDVRIGAMMSLAPVLRCRSRLKQA